MMTRQMMFVVAFVTTGAEEGQAWLKRKRQVPQGFGWLDPVNPPYDELPMQVSRIALTGSSAAIPTWRLSATRKSWAERFSGTHRLRRRSMTSSNFRPSSPQSGRSASRRH
ncbi:hypothetical protein SAMN05444166_1691 [Singulisphaera sp. GP187]|nr:hypothetical protein SAMN05444166_1691 [Singulisphaera sp. GP187]